MSDKKKVDPFDLDAGVPEVPAIEGELRPKPKFADRISKRILLVAFVAIAIVAVIFLASFDNIDNKKKAPKKIIDMQDVVSNPSDKTEIAKKGESAKEVLQIKDVDKGFDDKAPLPASIAKSPVGVSSLTPTEVAPVNEIGGEKTAGGKNANDFDSKLSPAKRAELAALAASMDKANHKVPALSGGEIPPANRQQMYVDSGTPQKSPKQIAEEQAKEARLTRDAQARATGLSARGFDGEGGAGGVGGSTSTDAIKALMAQAQAQGAGPGSGLAPPVQKNGPDGEQDEKLDFVKNAAKEDRGYHKSMPQAALSQNEVKNGAFIPLSLETGINSDLPGQITARVTEAVYDTTTGCRLLIPAMSKVVGKYDSKVALGQGRMLVVWNSMIFPDGAELNLAGMQGYDTGGMAGLPSDVDNHYLRLFGLTFGLSMLTAGTQLSVPKPNPGVNGAAAQPTTAQTIATALAQQYGQLGAQIIAKYMAVQPTLRNYPGERFTIMVPHTIMFEKVWKNRCGK